MSPFHLRSALRHLRRAAAQCDVGRSDAHLLERFATGDEAAFELLLWRHGPMVLGTCRRLLRREQDAEDAFQVTFLTLARKAGAIGKREAVGSWLYKVAYRAALQVRAAAERQPPAAPPGAEPAAPEEASAAEARELRPVLDEEVGRLPEKYRAPVVLCYLEGRTYEEAGRLLGCPTGTVAIRLRRARERLRVRLTRRGLAVPAGLVAAALVPAAAPGAVPAALFRATLESAAGPAPARLGTLTEGLVRSMFASKLKAVTAAVTVALAALGTGAGVLLSQGPGKPAGAAPAAPRPAAPKHEALRQEVPAEVSGVLLFVGTDVKPGEKVPAALLLKVKVDGKEQTFRRLRVGDRVEEGQLLARVDDRPARAELDVKRALLEVAQAEHRASQATREESQKRYESMLKAKKAAPGAVSEDELRGAKLTWDRYKEEERAKAAGVAAAEAQLRMARTILERHEVRSSLRGVIRAIYKRRGEAVKALEPVLQIEADETAPPPAAAAGKERIDVPAERDGKLIFLGTEIAPAERASVPMAKIITYEQSFLAVEITPEEFAKTPEGERVVVPGRKYRRWKEADPIEPGRVILVRQRRELRRLAAGEKVKEGQLLALVNPALAVEELSVKLAKLDAAEADRLSAQATKEEAQKRVDAIVKVRKAARPAVSNDEYRAAVLTWERYKQEEVAKTAAVWQAQREVHAALTVLKMYEVRSPVAAVVRRIYRIRGEAVKALESVVQIEETPRD
jgi:RNA polymerase sigma factor (sigma-70 family)